MDLFFPSFVLLIISSIEANPARNQGRNCYKQMRDTVDTIILQLKKQASNLRETDRQSTESYLNHLKSSANTLSRFIDYLHDTARSEGENSIDFLNRSVDFANHTVRNDLTSCLMIQRHVFHSVRRGITAAILNGEILHHDIAENSTNHAIVLADLKEWTVMYDRSSRDMEMNSGRHLSQSLIAMTACFNVALEHLYEFLTKTSRLIHGD